MRRSTPRLSHSSGCSFQLASQVIPGAKDWVIGKETPGQQLPPTPRYLRSQLLGSQRQKEDSRLSDIRLMRRNIRQVVSGALARDFQLFFVMLLLLLSTSASLAANSFSNGSPAAEIGSMRGRFIGSLQLANTPYNE